MQIVKITTGYVVQVFDTEKGVFTSQEFIAGDECSYESAIGTPVDSSLMGNPEPYLPFDMVQPTEDEQLIRGSIEVVDEQQRRDEKNGLYGGQEDIAN